MRSIPHTHTTGAPGDRGAAGHFAMPPAQRAPQHSEPRGWGIESLTPRERELLGLMAQGLSNAAISQRLYLSPKTVETHVRSIFTKLGLRDRDGFHCRVLAVLTYLRAARAQQAA